jgi:hypothetical protein
LTSLGFFNQISSSQPFVEACVEENALVEAGKWIRKFEDVAEKMQWFCNIGFAHMTPILDITYWASNDFRLSTEIIYVT